MKSSMLVKNKKILITGGLGFIGLNAACYFAKNNSVHVIDDCSRVGVETNIELLNKFNVGVSQLDISYFKELKDIFYAFKPDIVLHLAAQVAVTLSILNPVRDFRSNLQGSFNLLELARHSPQKPIVLYASTNKVYGNNNQDVFLNHDRYEMKTLEGISEENILSFETPYGCSKGAADQYFLDYCKTYQVPTVVFRQSCIYGPHQYGLEDQGWVAWFTICSVLDRPLTIFGDGKQVRDILYIDDMIDLYEKAIANIDTVKGEVFNVGGGPANTLSLNELVDTLKKKNNKSLPVSYADWRQGDQKVYISNIQKAEKLLGWKPKVDPLTGVDKLFEWVDQERENISSVHEKQEQSKNFFDVSIVIPAKNEETNINLVLDEISLFMSSSPYTYEVIVVNDRSTDRTAEVVSNYPFARLIDNKNKPGKGGALRCGFDLALGKYIAMMDADFSHDASDLPLMIDELKRHNGLVIGSRITGGSQEYNRIRAFGNIVLTWLFGFLHGRYLSDALNGFKVFHRDVYTEFEYSANGYEIEIELLVRALLMNRRITEIPSRERARHSGKAKSSVVVDGTKFCWRIIRERFSVPRRKLKQNEKSLDQILSLRRERLESRLDRSETPSERIHR